MKLGAFCRWRFGEADCVLATSEDLVASKTENDDRNILCSKKRIVIGNDNGWLGAGMSDFYTKTFTD
jgi:hypothetical protein